MSIHPLAHFLTITKHRHCVIAHCAKAGILWSGLFHDLSKYSPSEFITGAKYYVGTKSPNSVEREIYGYSSAWMHHKGRNRHHFEYWTDISPVTKENEPVKMPLRYVKEMFCDRLAASKIYRGSSYTEDYPLEYFYKERDARFMNPDTAALLEDWLMILKKDGEDAVFRHIRSVKNY